MLDHDMQTLKAENADLHRRLQMFVSELDTTKASLNMMNTRSKKLVDILCSQKAHIDKYDIGYIEGTSTFKNSVFTNPAVNVAHSTVKKRMCHVWNVNLLAIIVEQMDKLCGTKVLFFYPIAISCKSHQKNEMKNTED